VVQIRRIVAALAALAVVALPGPVAAAPGDGFVYQSPRPVPLAESRTYVLKGTATADGCQFDYPALVLGAGETTRLQRDIGIDQAHCRKLVEEGIPTADALAATDPSISSIAAPVGQGSATGGAAPAEVGHSGYTKIWWVDQPGFMVNQDETYISWIVSGGCVTQGHASGDWEWRSGTGWQIVSYGGTDELLCSRYKGETWSTYKNPVFCPFTTVYTYYYYVRAYGWSTGNPWITGSWSSNSFNQCLQLYERHEITQTG
jgi:hypothetical protein